MIKINNWSLVPGNYTPYTAPELVLSCLHGDAINHPKLGECTIRSSTILKVTGRIVYTESGNIYKLGKISKTYRLFLKHHYPDWNWRKPITMKGV